MGATPKPTALHLADGTFREDRHAARRREPKPGGRPVCPRHLSGEARKHWKAIVPGLIATGVATAADTPALVMLCEVYAEYRALHGDGSPSARMPAVRAAMRGALRDYLQLAAKFGLTPVDRTRIAAGEDVADAAAKKYGFA